MELIVAILPVVLLGVFIYKKDKNAEPGKLLAKLFFGGILSCFLTLIISAVMESFFPIFGANSEDLNLVGLFIYVFIGVALVEEFSKFVFAYSIANKDPHFDEIYDAIVYCVFVSLGFAAFENILYVSSYGLGTGILRALTAIPGHACDGVFMGYYLGLAKIAGVNKNEKLRKKNLMLSLLVPTLLHGIYDYCLMTGYVLFILLFIVFVIVLYIFSVKKINKLSAINTKFVKKNMFCTNCGRPVDSNFCGNCGKKIE